MRESFFSELGQFLVRIADSQTEVEGYTNIAGKEGSAAYGLELNCYRPLTLSSWIVSFCNRAFRYVLSSGVLVIRG